MATDLMQAALSEKAKREEKLEGIIAALGQIDTCQSADRMHSKIQALIRALRNGEVGRAELVSAVVSAK